jgi:hypothetical protein
MELDAWWTPGAKPPGYTIKSSLKELKNWDILGCVFIIKYCFAATVFKRWKVAV